MSAYRLRWKKRPSGLIDGSWLRPTWFAERPLAEIASQEVACGRRTYRLDELFDLESLSGESDTKLYIPGAENFLRLGAKIEAGILEIEGHAGTLVGAEQSGGLIRVHGCVGSRAGAGMSDGQVLIDGDAAELLGGPLPGAQVGITGGVIVVRGNAGEYVGLKQRRGLIAVAGSVGDYPGYRMLGGTLVAGGPLTRPGYGMEGGTILALGELAQVWPTFRRNAVSQPVFLRLLGRRLLELGFPWHADFDSSPFVSYAGDHLQSGRGEVFGRVVASH